MRTATYLRGACYAFAATALWASWSPITRLAVTTDLDAFDLAMLRIAVPGVLLLPIVVRHGLGLDRLGWSGLALLMVSGGVPYVMLAAGGLQFAPAHHQAALNAGCMPLFVALIAVVWMGESLASAQRIGLGLILAGALLIVGWQGPAWQPTLALGHAMFLVASLGWACFTVLLRHGRLEPLHAIALVGLGALPLVPFYAAWNGTQLLAAPVGTVAFQAVFQGVVITIVSLILYARALKRLGAAGGGAFGALVPVLATLFAIPLLGEWPTRTDWYAIVLVSIGVYLTSGGPLPGRSSVPDR